MDMNRFILGMSASLILVLSLTCSARAKEVGHALGADSLPQEGVPKGTVTKHTWDNSSIYPSGKEAHVAVSSSPKNEPCWFPINSLKPSATNKTNSFGAIADGRLYADVSNSLLYLCRHRSLLPCDEFAVLLH